MTAVIVEQEIDWAPFEELLDERPCRDCGAAARWIQTLECCKTQSPKCDKHKKMMEELMAWKATFRKLTWNCGECGAKGRCDPPSKVWELITWTPL